MKKNKLLLLLAVSSLVACSKKAPQTLYERWTQKSPPGKWSTLERKLASSPSNACMKDVFSVETLKEEIADLEKKFPGSQKVYGQWKHLDLSRLPVPQANFLKEFGQKIGDLRDRERIDYSGCEDVPCVINRIYNRDNFVGGYVHYIWYLKFGVMLAADNQVPRSNEKFAGNKVDVEGSSSPGEYKGLYPAFEDFLYNESELYGFWRLSHQLEGSYRTISELKEIQKVPRGQKFISPDTQGACGLAYSSGWILLTDGCLWFDRSTPDAGPFYEKVAHEISHMLDFHEGRGSQAFYRSHRPDYVALSGLVNREYKNAANVLVSKWETVPGARFASSYAKTNPQENFADTLAIFRTNGDLAKQNISSEHFSFVSTNYFDSRSFEKEELIKTWMRENRAETERAVLKVVMDCHSSTGSVRSSYFRASDFNQQTLPGMMNCYSYGAEEISQLIRAKILIEEAEGCNIVKDSSTKNLWDRYVKGLLIEAFEKYLQEMRNDPEYLARIQSFYSEVEDDSIAMSSYLSCYNRGDEESCFTTQLRKDAEAKAQSLRLNLDLTAEMTEMYVAQHSYANLRNKATTFYQSLIQANLETIQTEGDDLWKRCADQNHNDSVSPRGKHFTLSSGYLISSFYNCLNENIPETVKGFVRNVGVENFKLQHPNEEVIVTNLALPQLVRQLKSKYDDARAEEKQEGVKYSFTDEGKTREGLLANLSWVKRGSRGNEVNEECRRKSLALITYQPLYHTKQELFQEFIQTSVCANLEGTTEFKALREKEDMMTELLDRTEMRLRQEADIKARKCLDQYPIGGFLNKVRHRFNRENCLEENWEELERKVFNEMKNEPEVEKTSINPSEIQERLERSRKKVQQDTIKAHFAIF